MGVVATGQGKSFMIRVENLTLPYAIKGLSCHFSQNRLIGVLGANGAGKSSLIKSIAGIVRPSQGCIEVNTQNIQRLSYQQRSELVAYLAQETPVHWALSVYETIALGLVKPLSAAREREKVQASAAYFDVTDLLEQPIQRLSGGERARVHLARCLMKNAPVLLADEPIAALDPYYQLEIMQHLRHLSASVTCVVVLHHLSLAYRFCDEIVLLKDGELVASGETDSVMIAENLATAFKISATIDVSKRSIHTIRQLD